MQRKKAQTQIWMCTSYTEEKQKLYQGIHKNNLDKPKLAEWENMALTACQFKVIFNFNVIPIQISKQFLLSLEQKIKKLICKTKLLRTGKNNSEFSETD